jgi:hypothetical protein
MENKRGSRMDYLPFSTLLWAGVLSSIAGLLTFLIVHHFTIRPIWFIAPPGLLFAVGGGVAVAWAFETMQSRLGINPLIASVVFAVLLTLTQVPGFLIGSTREPIIDTVTANILPGRGWEAAGRFFLDLFVTAAITGALIGWLLAGNAASAARMALAAVAFSVGPGHNIPFFAGTESAGKMWAIMGLVIFVSALVFAATIYVVRRT